MDVCLVGKSFVELLLSKNCCGVFCGTCLFLVKVSYYLSLDYFKQFLVCAPKFEKGLKMAESSALEGACSICEEIFDGEKDVAATQCGHTFHAKCLLEWIRRKPECPTCRKNAPESEIIAKLFFNLGREISVYDRLMSRVNFVDHIPFLVLALMPVLYFRLLSSNRNVTP